MLQAIRGRAASWVVRILFVMLIFSFLGWGISDYLNKAKAPSEVARVGSVRIDPQVFSTMVSRELERLRRVVGSLDRAQAKQLGLIDQVLNQMISQSLVEQEGRRLGIVVSDAVVRGEILRNPAFVDEKGQFDKARFEQILARSGYTEDRLVGDIRRDMARAELMRSIGDGAKAPAALVDPLLAYRGETRVARLVTIASDPTAAVPEPSEDALKSFYETHKPAFTAPEYRALTILPIAPADVVGEVRVSDAEIETAFQQRQNEFVLPEKRVVDQILVDDETKAKEARARLAAGEDFVKVGEAMGMKAEAIHLGAMAKDELPGPLGETTFALAKDAVSDPVKSDFGWSILRVSEIKPGVTPSLADVQARLRDELTNEKAADLVYERANKIEDALAGGGSLADAAAKFGLKTRVVAAVDRAGKDPDGLPVPDLSPKQIQAAFGQEAGQGAQALDLGNARFAVVHTDSIVPPTLKPFDAVKTDVLSAWRRNERDAAAKAKAEAIATALRAGGDIEALAKENGVVVRRTEPFARDGALAAKLSPDLVSRMFAATATNPPVVALSSGQDGETVALLDKITPIDAAKSEAQKASIEKSMKEAIAQDIAAGFEAALREHFPVTVNQATIDQMF